MQTPSPELAAAFEAVSVAAGVVLDCLTETSTALQKDTSQLEQAATAAAMAGRRPAQVEWLPSYRRAHSAVASVVGSVGDVGADRDLSRLGLHLRTLRAICDAAGYGGGAVIDFEEIDRQLEELEEDFGSAWAGSLEAPWASRSDQIRYSYPAVPVYQPELYTSEPAPIEQARPRQEGGLTSRPDPYPFGGRPGEARPCCEPG